MASMIVGPNGEIDSGDSDFDSSDDANDEDEEETKEGEKEEQSHEHRRHVRRNAEEVTNVPTTELSAYSCTVPTCSFTFALRSLTYNTFNQHQQTTSRFN